MLKVFLIVNRYPCLVWSNNSVWIVRSAITILKIQDNPVCQLFCLRVTWYLCTKSDLGLIVFSFVCSIVKKLRCYPEPRIPPPFAGIIQIRYYECDLSLPFEKHLIREHLFILKIVPVWFLESNIGFVR